jgi:hypothetical protein
MYNVTPDGQEAIAFRNVYERVAEKAASCDLRARSIPEVSARSSQLAGFVRYATGSAGAGTGVAGTAGVAGAP